MSGEKYSIDVYVTGQGVFDAPRPGIRFLRKKRYMESPDVVVWLHVQVGHSHRAWVQSGHMAQILTAEAGYSVAGLRDVLKPPKRPKKPKKSELEARQRMGKLL